MPNYKGANSLRSGLFEPQANQNLILHVLKSDRCRFCPAGSIGVDGRLGLIGTGMCVPCDAGYYRDQAGATCEPCSIGRYSGGGGAPCTDCPEPATVTGQTINGVEYPSSVCALPYTCAPGTGCPYDQASCSSQDDCAACGTGMASLGILPCVLCDELGKVATADQSVCEGCQAGRQPNTARSACVDCTGNTFSQVGHITINCCSLSHCGLRWTDMLVCCTSSGSSVTRARPGGWSTRRTRAVKTWRP
jgi:hypothetical protein